MMHVSMYSVILLHSSNQKLSLKIQIGHIVGFYNLKGASFPNSSNKMIKKVLRWKCQKTKTLKKMPGRVATTIPNQHNCVRNEIIETTILVHCRK